MFVPSGVFSTPHRMRLLLADCPTIREVLETTNVSDAMSKIITYGVESDADGTPRLSYPRILIQDQEVHLQTDTMGGLLEVQQRTLFVWIGFYVPEDVEGIEDVSDEHAWVLEKFSEITSQCLERTGRGEAVMGETFLCVENPVFLGAEKEPHDERGDAVVDVHPEQSRWFGLLAFEVR